MNFLSEIDDRKGTEEEKIKSKQMCVSSQNHRMKKEEGAAVDSSAILPYLSSAGRALSRQAGPAAFYHELPKSGKE